MQNINKGLTLGEQELLPSAQMDTRQNIVYYMTVAAFYCIVIGKSGIQSPQRINCGCFSNILKLKVKQGPVVSFLTALWKLPHHKYLKFLYLLKNQNCTCGLCFALQYSSCDGWLHLNLFKLDFWTVHPKNGKWSTFIQSASQQFPDLATFMHWWQHSSWPTGAT